MKLNKKQKEFLKKDSRGDLQQIEDVANNEHKKVKIMLENWDYTCGYKCCYYYGTKISVNGVKCENQYAGDDVKESLKFALKQLGFEVEIEEK